MLTVMCSCNVFFRLLDVGVRQREKRKAPTTDLCPGVVPTNAKRQGTNMKANLYNTHTYRMHISIPLITIMAD